ncbi:hypothetical protein ES705_14666 [subsurface metagenome]
MANSFNISVKPEIAAVSALVVAVDAVVDAIRATDVVNIQANIDDNEDLLDLIRGTDVVNLASAIANNAVAIEVIDGIVDAIKIKTDATPQNVRAKLAYAQLTTAEAAFQTLCNVTGHGIIRNIYVNADPADTIEIKLTIDATVLGVWSGNATKYIGCTPYRPDVDILELVGITAPPERNLFLEFESSFKLEIRRSGGTTENVHCKVNYSLDSF